MMLTRKYNSINNNDIIRFCYQHNYKRKFGVIMGFYVTFFRICSLHFLREEETYIESTFKQYFLQNANHNVYKIHRKKYRNSLIIINPKTIKNETHNPS